MKKRDQVALPSHAGFGEDAFDLRSHRTIGHDFPIDTASLNFVIDE